MDLISNIATTKFGTVYGAIIRHEETTSRLSAGPLRLRSGLVLKPHNHQPWGRSSDVLPRRTALLTEVAS